MRGLSKSYGRVDAVRDIDFDVADGEAFALLGPNGAGKTTTVEILEGYRSRTGGCVEVLGEDPERGGPAWRARIGIVLPGLRPRPSTHGRRKYLRHTAVAIPKLCPVDELLELVGLTGKTRARPDASPEGSSAASTSRSSAIPN